MLIRGDIPVQTWTERGDLRMAAKKKAKKAAKKKK
jgi:hypothetical protein